MRYCVSLLLLITTIISCSKKNTVRTHFAELTLGGDKFVFDSLDAVVDTSAQEFSCNFLVFDRASNSYMNWEIISGSKWINGVYEYPGEPFPARSVVYLHIQTYIDRVPGTYTLAGNSLTLTIDQSENGRMHGTFAGKVICYTCVPYGTVVNISRGEFEIPYSYR
jgi:hypothetical protein